MCSPLESSTLDVLDVFSADEPRSVADVYEHYGVEVLNLVLGSDMSVARLIGLLVRQGDLLQQGDGFVLTEQGLATRERLRTAVAA